MGRKFADMVVESSQTLGLTDYVLDGATGSYRSFRDAYITGDTPSYVVRNKGNTKWEKNRGGVFTTGTPDQIARNVVLSTNNDGPVNWTADDRPLTIYVPRDSDVDEGAIS